MKTKSKIFKAAYKLAKTFEYSYKRLYGKICISIRNILKQEDGVRIFIDGRIKNGKIKNRHIYYLDMTDKQICFDLEKAQVLKRNVFALLLEQKDAYNMATYMFQFALAIGIAINSKKQVDDIDILIDAIIEKGKIKYRCIFGLNMTEKQLPVALKKAQVLMGNSFAVFVQEKDNFDRNLYTYMCYSKIR